MSSAAQALLWGGLGASSLLLGGLFALGARPPARAVGLLLAFGAGTLLSAVAYELVPAERGFPIDVAVAIGVGAVVYYLADMLLERREGGAGGSGIAIALGTLLDGVPESLVLGIGIGMGNPVSVAFLVAVFVSNLPESIAGSSELLRGGRRPAWVLGLWAGIVVLSALAAAIGSLIASSMGADGDLIQAFAAGAMITMIADTMLPNARETGGRPAGLATVLGFALAALLSGSE